jgi:hypothetical protein
MAYETTNLAFRIVAVKVGNKLSFDGKSYDSLENDQILTFKFKVDYHDLHDQARLFSRDFLSHGLDYRRIFGTRDYKWARYSAECFVYSYFVAVFTGVYATQTGSINQSAKVFIGHALFSQILRRRIFSELGDNDVRVSISIDVSSVEDDRKADKITNTFSFLKGCIFENESGRYTVYSGRHASFIEKMTQFDDRNLVKIESLFEISTDINNLLLNDKVPLGNSYRTDDGKIDYLFSDQFDISYNPSYWLNHACHLYLKKSDIDYPSNHIYDSFDTDGFKVARLRRDVHAATYLLAKANVDNSIDLINFKEKSYNRGGGSSDDGGTSGGGGNSDEGS